MRFIETTGIVLILTSAAMMALAPVSLVAQEANSTKDDEESARLHKVLDGSLKLYEVSSVQTTAPGITPKPVLRWINDERDSHSVGHVALWLDRGQPVIAMATYIWSNQYYVEFDLLSREPVTVKNQTAVIWQPQAGLEFQPIPNSPAVETSAPARLRQIKLMSEQFNATMLGWRADNSDRTELRRLPRELYRYQPENSKVIDGAIFAFVQGTDPEALLMIEAVKTEKRSEWQYAFIRQTSGELEGRHSNRVVWKAARYPSRTVVTAPGLTLTNVTLE